MTSSVTRLLRGYKRLQQDRDGASIPMSTFPSKNRFHRRSHQSSCTILRIIPHYITLRRIVIFLGILFFIIIGTILSSGIPPRYKDIWDYEKSLPQHNLTKAHIDLKRGKKKYLRFEGGVQGRGLNNVLQEELMLSYVAYRTQRAFVFEDYVWSLHSPFSSTVDEWALRPSRIPLNAIISGPTAGGPILIDVESSPVEFRSVHLEFFDKVCPTHKRVTLRAADIPSDKEGNKIVDWWVNRLQSVKDEPCVVVDSSKSVFDFYFFGSSKDIIPAFESLRHSPILMDFAWSPLVLSAISRNFAILQPPNLKDLYDQSGHSTMKGTIAIHLRRGDFYGHCLHLTKHSSRYMGLNTYPGIPDSFDPEAYLHQSTQHYPENENEKRRLLKPYYFEHCLPEIDQIVRRLRKARKDHPSLDLSRVYLLSNGKASWLNKLAMELKHDGWEDVRSSVDLKLDAQQKYVSGAIDMAIAEKAELFIGNGFSSLSSNIVMLRLAKGLPPSSNGFL